MGNYLAEKAKMTKRKMEEKEIKKRIISTMNIATILILALIVVQSTKAQTTTLSVEPQTIDPTLIPGDTFTINCSVADVVDLFIWQIKLFFDPTILNCTGAWYPSDHVFAGKIGVPVIPIIDNEIGYVLHGYSLLGAEPGFDGSGTLCQIEFEVISCGKSGLNYSEPYGADTFLLDSNLDEISTEVKNGYFNNTHDVAITSVVPSETVIELGDTVSVVVTVENQGVATETFDLSVYFNTTEVGTQTVTSLPEKTSKTLTLICETEDLEKGNYTVSAYATPVPWEEDIGDNTFTEGMITIIAYHDVAIIEVTPSKTQVVQGLSISIYVTVENQGHYTETFSVTVYYDTNSIETEALTLDRKTSRELTFTWDTTGVPLGNYTISAEASEVPDEIDTTDNTFTDGIVRIVEAPPSDIAVIDVKSFKTVVMQGYIMRVLVTVENQGLYTETFSVTAYVDTIEINTKEITLESGASTTITFLWNSTGFNLYENYTVSAYSHPLPGEADTDDNSYIDGRVIVAIVGDAIPNGKVEMKDIGIVARAFGSYPGQPNWYPNADITGPEGIPDDAIEMRDIGTIAKEFGKTYP